MKITTLAGVLTGSGLALVLGQMHSEAVPMFVLPPSFTCSTATTLALGDNAFDTTSATVNLSVPSSSCSGAHTVYKSAYWSFTPPTTGNYDFSTCTGTTWDTRLVILNSCNTANGVVACNDDACNFQSTVTASLTAGTSYIVVVGGYGSGNAGAGNLNVAASSTGGGGGGGGGSGSPDVIVGAIPDISKYGAGTINGVSYMAYAIGTTSCNIGNAQLEWFASPDSRHPFIPMNMYRLKGGKIEQIGMSWGKHGFTALQGTLCGSCQASSTGNYLGIGCSDPYSSGLNGGQSGLGTRSEINAHTGTFPGTYNAGMPPAPSTYGRRLAVKASDLDPAQNAGAVYFVEGHYIHPQDAAANNDNNNASYRQVTVGAISSGAYTLTLTGATIQQKAAIEAWKASDPTVTQSYADAQGDGRFIVSSKARDLGNGQWRYEYAVHNLNSHRSGRSFSVPVPAGASISNVGFKDIDYHSGDPYAATDWTSAVSGGSVTWTGGDFATSANGNALRFATLYNFWFDANVAPASANATIGLFRPGAAGDPNSVTASIQAPSAPSNPSDLNDDGVVDGADLGILLGAWGTAAGDINGDGTTDGADLGILLGGWG